MKLFKIDDGAEHTIVAGTEAEAYGLYVENLVLSGAAWPKEKPSIREVEDEKEWTLCLDGGPAMVTLKGRLWRLMIQRPMYLGCSDF
ncbi:MAG: hypothetical protein ACRDGM_06610 [bacterium]